MKQFLILIVMSLMFTSCGFEIVDTGHVGVKRSYGKIVETNIKPGLEFYLPFVYSISEVDVRVNKFTGKMSESRGAATKDNQNVAIEYAVNFSYDPVESGYIFEQGNELYADKVLPQVIEGSIRDIIGQYNAEDLAQKLSEVRTKVNGNITDNNLKGVKLGNIELTNIDFSDEFERAVEAKVTAVQRAKEEENRTVQVKQQAEQKVALAQADAEAIKIKAQALSQNAKLVELEAVQRWDGKAPRIIMGGGSFIPFMNMNNLAK